LILNKNKFNLTYINNSLLIAVASHLEKLNNFINKYRSNLDKVLVLEAGCGSISHIRFDESAIIHGIDISQKQLDRNKYLHKKILGDLHTHNLGDELYNIIVCWDVLEHLEKPLAAIDNMTKALLKDGILIIKVPNVLSIKGLITKFTPYVFHNSIYKYIFKRKTSTKEDIGPFKTHLKFSIRKQSLVNYLKDRMKVVYNDEYDISDLSQFYKKSVTLRIFLKAYRRIKNVVKIITFGKIDNSEFIIIFQKI